MSDKNTEDEITICTMCGDVIREVEEEMECTEDNKPICGKCSWVYHLGATIYGG